MPLVEIRTSAGRLITMHLELYLPGGPLTGLWVTSYVTLTRQQVNRKCEKNLSAELFRRRNAFVLQNLGSYTEQNLMSFGITF